MLTEKNVVNIDDIRICVKKNTYRTYRNSCSKRSVALITSHVPKVSHACGRLSLYCTASFHNGNSKTFYIFTFSIGAHG